MELASNIGGRDWDDEIASLLDFTVWLELRLEEALLLPPVVWPRLACTVANWED